MSSHPTTSPVDTSTGAPAAAEQVFGDRLPLAVEYAALLGGAGVERGLIGPNETSRIWERHLLNCAVATELIPEGVRVVDVGSGAGLPGLAMALRRPDLTLQLVEPMQRRTEFLTAAVRSLGLDHQVEVVRGRAEDARTRARVEHADRVTARAVAPLERLVRWCLPLVADDGRLVLLKGADAAEELDRSRSAIRRAGALDARVVRCGVGVVDPPTTVVEIAAHRPDPRPQRPARPPRQQGRR